MRKPGDDGPEESVSQADSRNAFDDVGESHFVSAPDGLRLHVRSYGSRRAPFRNVLCLPGLTRNGADFATLAGALSRDAARPRRVLALDYRGRGKSDYDRDARHYSFAVELADLFAVLTACAAWPAIFIGTSRGGLLTMLAAAARPNAIAGAVLNDIGPVVENAGLLRIKSYVGKLPEPRNLDEAADILRRLFGAQFPKLRAQDWLGYARRSFAPRGGRLVANYDPKLMRTLNGIDLARPLPPLWAQFDALKRAPIMAIRGENSDILSAATLAAMQARRPDLEAIEVADQGHAPLLDDAGTIGRIAAFVASCDAAG